MSIKEANRLSVMRQVDKKVLNIGKASEELGISLRQAKRIRKRYLKEGEIGLISKHRGKIERFDTGYERNGVSNVLLSFEPLTGKRYIDLSERRTRLD